MESSFRPQGRAAGGKDAGSCYDSGRVKDYRQNSHAASLVVWALMSACLAGFLFWHAGHIVSRRLETLELVGGAALLLFGPVALLIYLLRANLVWVAVDPDEGVVVSGRRVIPFGDIVRVERRRPRLRKKAGPAEVSAVSLADAGGWAPGCGDVGCFAAAGEGALMVLGFLAIAVAALFVVWLVFFAFVPFIGVPLMEVFAPLGDRVRIVTKERPLLLRDLRGAEEFLAELRARGVAVEER
jgi:hypothetical protein